MPLPKPTRWTAKQLQADADKATAAFRRERLDESLERYLEEFDACRSTFDAVIDQLSAFSPATIDAGECASALTDDTTRRALRYLTAPPISDDDLKTLAGASSLAPSTLADDPEAVVRIRDTLFRMLDPRRLPWIAEGRAPTKLEREIAVVASSALVAARRVETFRRSEAKDRQEERVKETLRVSKFAEIPKRDIKNAATAPKAGEFMGETPVVGARADVVAGLYDGRLMIIECKVSNSTVNSYKRIVHDTGGKATIWHAQFGRANVLVAAVLSGVFSPANCEFVQNEKDVFLFWDHRLADLRRFIAAAR